MQTGFKRLAVLAALLAATAVATYLLIDTILHGLGSVPLWLAALATAGCSLGAAAAAWFVVRGIAWVCAGFTRRGKRFTKPNWN